MIHTVQIKLIVNKPIKVGEKEVSIDDIESIEIGDNYRINKVNRTKSNRGEDDFKK